MNEVAILDKGRDKNKNNFVNMYILKFRIFLKKSVNFPLFDLKC